MRERLAASWESGASRLRRRRRGESTAAAGGSEGGTRLGEGIFLGEGTSWNTWAGRESDGCIRIDSEAGES